MSEGNGIYTFLSAGYWSGLVAIGVAITALIAENDISRGKLTALLVMCVADFFVALAAISTVIVAAYDSDYCAQKVTHHMVKILTGCIYDVKYIATVPCIKQEQTMFNDLRLNLFFFYIFL